MDSKSNKKLSEFFGNNLTPRRDAALRKAIRDIDASKTTKLRDSNRRKMSSSTGGKAGAYLEEKLKLRLMSMEGTRKAQYALLKLEAEQVKWLLSHPPEMEEEEAASYLNSISRRLEALLESQLIRQ